MKLVDQLARVDEKLDSLREQYKIDVDNLKTECISLRTKIDAIEEIRADLIKEIESTKNEFNKWKIYWAAVAFIIAPIVTAVVIWICHEVFHF